MNRLKALSSVLLLTGAFVLPMAGCEVEPGKPLVVKQDRDDVSQLGRDLRQLGHDTARAGRHAASELRQDARGAAREIDREVDLNSPRQPGEPAVEINTGKPRS